MANIARPSALGDGDPPRRPLDRLLCHATAQGERPCAAGWLRLSQRADSCILRSDGE